MSATPETDALYAQMLAENPGNFIHLEEFLELACRLERERDEWYFKAHENFKFTLDARAERDEWAAMCGRYKQERDEAREALMKIEDLFIDGTDIYAGREMMGIIARNALEGAK